MNFTAKSYGFLFLMFFILSSSCNLEAGHHRLPNGQPDIKANAKDQKSNNKGKPAPLHIELSEKTKKEIIRITNVLVNRKDKRKWSDHAHAYIECLKKDSSYKPGSDTEKMVQAFEAAAQCKSDEEIQKLLEPFQSVMKAILTDSSVGGGYMYALNIKKQMRECIQWRVCLV